MRSSNHKCYWQTKDRVPCCRRGVAGAYIRFRLRARNDNYIIYCRGYGVTVDVFFSWSAKQASKTITFIIILSYRWSRLVHLCPLCTSPNTKSFTTVFGCGPVLRRGYNSYAFIFREHTCNTIAGWSFRSSNQTWGLTYLVVAPAAAGCLKRK